MDFHWTGRSESPAQSFQKSGSSTLVGDPELILAAAVYATRVSRARPSGRAVSMGDGQIVAIAAVHGFTVATRDMAPFIAAGVPVMYPWKIKGKE